VHGKLKRLGEVALVITLLGGVLFWMHSWFYVWLFGFVWLLQERASRRRKEKKAMKERLDAS
jgi:hypothetical protein